MPVTEKTLPELDIPELRAPFVFRRRPVALPGDLRPTWRIGLLVLLLAHCCRGSRTSFARLHVLSWGFRTAEGRRQLLDLVSGRLTPSALVIRFEPFLIQAVDYALAEHLIQREGGNRVKLTERGKSLAKELDANDSVFAKEKQAITLVRTKISEDIVNRMFVRGAK